MMLKKELLDQAEALGIELNNKAIERYVEYGLIVGKRVSQGYSMGVVTQYHERTIEAIQLIDELKSSKMFKHQKDYIFILYWKGYPVDWYKLKTRLLEFHTSIMESFKVIADYTTDPSYKEIMDDIAEDEAKKASKAIGRPTKQSIEIQESEARETAKGYILVSKLISGIFNNGTVSKEVFRAFNKRARIESEFMDDSILVHANNWLQMKTWRNEVKQSEEQHYQETYELISLLKEYWSDLVGNYGDIYDIPLIGGFVKKLEEDFHIKVFSDRPWFYRFVALILISGGFRQLLMDFLSNPVTRESWNLFIAAIPTLLSNNTREEVTLNG
jgi:hypothetical protein